MNSHVINSARACYFELRCFASIRRFLTSTVTATLVSALFCQEMTTVAHCCLILLMTETWLSAQGDEEKTVELTPSGLDVKSFPRQSRSRGGEIATIYKSTLGYDITFKKSLILLTHRSK